MPASPFESNRDTVTGAATINANGLGGKAVVDNNGAAMHAGALTAGHVYSFAYDGTSFELQSPAADTLYAEGVLSRRTLAWPTPMSRRCLALPRLPLA